MSWSISIVSGSVVVLIEIPRIAWKRDVTDPKTHDHVRPVDHMDSDDALASRTVEDNTHMEA